MKPIKYHGEAIIRAICESGSVSAVHIKEGTGGEFHLVLHTPDSELRLQKKRSGSGRPDERTFKDLTRAARFAKSLGFVQIQLEMSHLYKSKQSALNL